MSKEKNNYDMEFIEHIEELNNASGEMNDKLGEIINRTTEILSMFNPNMRDISGFVSKMVKIDPSFLIIFKTYSKNYINMTKETAQILDIIIAKLRGN